MADTLMATAAQIATLRSAGATWAQIGSVINGGNPDPRLAKKRAHAIAREANRRAAAMLAEEARDA